MILYDTFTVDGVRRTSDGYLAAHARVARTGIQVYRGAELGRPELDEVRVYRPPEEVFAPDAMQSFAHRPVTLKHPKVPVTARNWKRYAGGQTGDEVVRDGEYVRVPMVMMDAALISAYERGEASQLSMGYSTDLQWRTGIVDSGPDQGQKYDAVQTAIRGNHLAVVPLARGGDQLRIGDGKRGKTLAFDVENEFRALTDRMKAMNQDDDDDDDDLEDAAIVDAWSDEARAAALEARKGRTSHKNMADRHIRLAYFRNSPSTGEDDKNTGSHEEASRHHVMASYHFDKANEAFKSGEMKRGESHMKLGKKFGNTAKRMSSKLGVQMKDSSPSGDDDVDYVSCPECGADVPSDEDSCPKCGHEMSNTNDGASEMKTIIIDGVPVSVADDQAAAIIDRQLTSLGQQVKDAGLKLADALVTSTKLQSQLDDAAKGLAAKDGEIAVLNKKVADAAVTPEKLDVMVKDRLTVIDAASTVLDRAFVYDGKTVEQIRRAAVEMVLGDAAKGMSDDVVGGAFIAATMDAKKSTAGGSQPIRRAMLGGGGNSSQVVDAARQTAYDEYVKRETNAWKGDQRKTA